MDRSWGVLLGLLLVLLSSRPALADLYRAPEAPPVRPQVLDYRYQLVLSDATAVGLLIAASESSNRVARRDLLYASLFTYALAPPLIHALNDQPFRALGSLGLRVVAPVTGGAIGVLLAGPICAEDDSGWRCVGALIVFVGGGMVVGGLHAVIVDDAFLGRVPQPRTVPPGKARRGFRATLAPMADPVQRSLGFSLAGTF